MMLAVVLFSPSIVKAELLNSNIGSLKSVVPVGFSFKMDLRLGDIDPDVQELQKMLNADPETMINIDGEDSRGQETTYFGPATQAAVVKFQNKYKDTVLTLNSLNEANGRVDLPTRTKLNLLIGDFFTYESVGSPQGNGGSSVSEPIVTETEPAVTACQLVDLLITSGIISSDKATLARTALDCTSSTICQFVDLLISVQIVPANKANIARRALNCVVGTDPVLDATSVTSGVSFLVNGQTSVTLQGNQPHTLTWNTGGLSCSASASPVTPEWQGQLPGLSQGSATIYHLSFPTTDYINAYKGPAVFAPDGTLIEAGVMGTASGKYASTINFSQAGGNYPDGSFVQLTNGSRCSISNPSTTINTCTYVPPNRFSKVQTYNLSCSNSKITVNKAVQVNLTPFSTGSSNEIPTDFLWSPTGNGGRLSVSYGKATKTVDTNSCVIPPKPVGVADKIKFTYTTSRGYKLDFTKNNTGDIYTGGTIKNLIGKTVCTFDANEDIRHAVNQGRVPAGMAQCSVGHGEPIHYVTNEPAWATVYGDGYSQRADKQVSGTINGIFAKCNLTPGNMVSLKTEVLSYFGQQLSPKGSGTVNCSSSVPAISDQTPSSPVCSDSYSGSSGGFGSNSGSGSSANPATKGTDSEAKDLDHVQVIAEPQTCIGPLQNMMLPVYSYSNSEPRQYVWVLGESQLVDNLLSGMLLGGLTSEEDEQFTDYSYSVPYSLPSTGEVLDLVVGDDVRCSLYGEHPKIIRAYLTLQGEGWSEDQEANNSNTTTGGLGF